MSETDFGKIMNAADKVASPAYPEDSQNQKNAALSLWAEAGLAIPFGGVMKSAVHSVRYADGSTVNEITYNGASQVMITERGEAASCDKQKDSNEKASLQQTFECMREAHGAVAGSVTAFDDGAGFTMSSNDSNFTLAGKQLWQSESKSTRQYQPMPALTLTNEQDGREETLTVLVRKGNGTSEKIQFYREDYLKPAEPPVLTSVQILDSRNKVVSERQPNLELW
ncbi:MAG: hypothetical protein HY986_05210 [Candidatus Melainabacteria bacterium]|nr:hypothetical protein [Candidatus Melainabacteria bacterium]